MIVKTALSSPFIWFIRDITRGKSWKIKLFENGGKDCKEIFQWPHSYAILLFFAKALVLRRSVSLLFMTNLLEHRVTRWKVSDRCHIVYLIGVSNARCWQNLSKLTNQRVYQILVYRTDLLLSLPTGVLSLPLSALFFIFSRAAFYAAPWLTERLEEATLQLSILILISGIWECHRLFDGWRAMTLHRSRLIS